MGRRKKRNRGNQKKIARQEKNNKREEKHKEETKQIEYNPERKTLINMENGLRTLNIASLNPDSFKEETTRQEIINGLTKENPYSNNTRNENHSKSQLQERQLPNHHSSLR